MTLRLPRQSNPYTSGPVALQAAALLQGTTLGAWETDAELRPLPGVGTDNVAMLSMATRKLQLSPDQDVWHGGLALANIRNPLTSVGQFVVMLGREGAGQVRYYCPLHGRSITLPQSQLQWCSGDGRHVDWVVNLATPEPALNPPHTVDSTQHVHILGDPMETLKRATDTSLLLLDAYRAQKRVVFWNTIEDIAVINGDLWLGGLPVEAHDIVWIRLDHVNTVRYYEILRLLCSVKKGVFLNSPQAILTVHDKLSAQPHRATTIVAAATSEIQVNLALRHLDTQTDTRLGYVVKQPSGFGGAGVERALNHAEVVDAFDRMQDASGYVLIEPFIPAADGAQPVDTRVVVAHGEVLGAVARVASDGFRRNLSAGATAQAVTNLPLAQVTPILATLAKEKVFLAGIDILNGEVTEVNVSCPSTLTDLNQVTGLRTELALIREADRWVADKTGYFSDEYRRQLDETKSVRRGATFD